MRIVSAEVVKYTAERGTRAGQQGEYVQLELEKRTTQWVANNVTRTFTYQLLNPRLVETFKGFIPSGKTKASKEDIPAEYQNIDNYFIVPVELGAPHYRCYRKPEYDKDGKLLHKKGEPYKDDDGNPIIYTTVEVAAIKAEDDDTGEMYWLDRPEAIVHNMITRGYYKPVTTAVAQETNLINSASDPERPDTNNEPPAEETREEKLARLKAELAAAENA